MFLPCIRSLAIAAAAVIACGSVAASDLTTFPAKYDALTVTSEVQVEALASVVAAINNRQVGDAFQQFLGAYSNDVADGTLTVDAHNKRIDDFLQSVNAIVPNFSTTGEAAIGAVVVDFFKFQLNAHAASWDVLYYGASTAQTQLDMNPTIGELLMTVDTYMTQNIGSATSADLQAQCDSFIAQSEAAAPGFRDLMYNTIGELYTSLWVNQDAGGAGNTGSHKDDATVGSGQNGSAGGSTGTEDEAGVPSGSNDSSVTPSPTPTDASGDNAPSPAVTSSANAIAVFTSATVVAIAVASTVMLL